MEIWAENERFYPNLYPFFQHGPMGTTLESRELERAVENWIDAGLQVWSVTSKEKERDSHVPTENLRS
jgi:hypothetical protein